MDIPPEEAQKQLANPDEYGASGLTEFIIAGAVIITIAVALRLWARRMVGIELKSDDWNLIVAWFLSICGHICQLFIMYGGHFGHHTLVLTPHQLMIFGKAAYAWDIIYTIAYPIARISLVLLYRRVFIQRWFRSLCWFLIGCYSCYGFSSAIAGFCQGFPIASNWDVNVKPTRHIDDKKLYLANSGFNITTDAILLVMPLAVIWSMNLTYAHKAGLSAVFCLGVLTLIASILRLVYYYRFDPYDPMFTLGNAGWWTMVEMDLGIICPCLVTFRPLIRSAFLVFSTYLSPATRARLERATGTSSRSPAPKNGNVQNDGVAGQEKSRDKSGSATRHKEKTSPTNDLEKGKSHSTSSTSDDTPLSHPSSTDKSPDKRRIDNPHNHQSKLERQALETMDLDSPPETKEATEEREGGGYFGGGK